MAKANMNRTMEILLEGSDELAAIEVALDKAILVNESLFEMTTPGLENESEEFRAYYALREQEKIATASSIVMDYLYNVKERLEQLQTEIEKIQDKEREEQTEHGE